MNHHTISAPGTIGIFVNGALNANIMNGTIFDTNNGLELINTTSSEFSNITIINCSNTGIQFDLIPSGIVLQNIIIDTTTTFGIGQSQIVGPSGLANSTLLNILVRNCAGTAFNIPNALACVFDNCQVIDCFGEAQGFVFGGSGSVFRNCIVMNCAYINGFSTFGDTLMENCAVIGLTGNGAVEAFVIGTNEMGFSNAQLRNCSAIDIQSTIGSTGFALTGPSTILENCFVQTCSSTSNFNLNFGFFIESTECTLIGCQAELSAGYGFFIENAGVTLQYCSANSNSIDGFLCENASQLLGYCSAFENGGVGFNATTGIAMYGCFASGNGINNYVNAPNVQPAATAGAFANSFI